MSTSEEQVQATVAALDRERAGYELRLAVNAERSKQRAEDPVEVARLGVEREALSARIKAVDAQRLALGGVTRERKGGMTRARKGAES